MLKGKCNSVSKVFTDNLDIDCGILEAHILEKDDYRNENEEGKKEEFLKKLFYMRKENMCQYLRSYRIQKYQTCLQATRFWPSRAC